MERLFYFLTLQSSKVLSILPIHSTPKAIYLLIILSFSPHLIRCRLVCRLEILDQRFSCLSWRFEREQLEVRICSDEVRHLTIHSNPV